MRQAVAGNEPRALTPWRLGATSAVHTPEASWRSGYAEDCKSLHPGSIPGEASTLQTGPIKTLAGFVKAAFAINRTLRS